MKRALRKHRRFLWLAGGIILVLVIAALIWQFQTQNTKPSSTSDIVTVSAEPSTVPIGPDFTWDGAPNEPKKLFIPRLGIEGFIQKVGVDQNGEVAVPTNIALAGWFVDSVRPGEKGLSVIDGHISTGSEKAIFQRLSEVKTGDVFSIEFGDGLKKDFVVFGVKDVTREDAPAVLFSQDPTVARQLNLITCGGDYDDSESTFTRRVIVQAKPVS